MGKEGDRRPSEQSGAKRDLSKNQRKQLTLLAVTGTRVDWNAALNMGLVQPRSANAQ